MNLKNKIPALTNVLSIGMGYILSQNNLLFCKIAMGVCFVLWIVTMSQMKE